VARVIPARRGRWRDAAFVTNADGFITDVWVIGDLDDLRRRVS
jgi:hypothetical protein